MTIGRICAIAASLLIVCTPSIANDSFAEVGAGGIRFLKHATISIAEETLTISRKSVDVAYSFYNPGDDDITIDVAFPVPEYSGSPDGVFDFADFVVTSNGTAIVPSKDTRAFVEKRDVTSDLKALGISIEDFDGYDTDRWRPEHLTPEARERLMSLGAFAHPWENTYPRWSVRTTYYWHQTFPAKSMTRVTHRYAPALGGEYFQYESRRQDWSADRLLLPGCRSGWRGDWSPTKTRLGELLFRDWLRYILTTANNWHGPIGRFTVRIDRTQDEAIMVCSDLGRLEVTTGSVTAIADNYRPTRDLLVAFIYQRP